MDNDIDISELTDRGRRLAPEHRAHLEAHAIDIDLAERLGVHSALAPDDLPAELMGWGGRLVPSIIFPWSANGETWPQARPDLPIELEGGKRLKYVYPEDSGGALWIVHDPTRPIGVLLVEGTKQALAVASLEPPWKVVAIGGCWGWITDGVVSAGLYGIAEALPVVMMVDADLRTNPDVHAAVSSALASLPVVTGASSVTASIAPGSGVTGVDDALAGVPAIHRGRYLEQLIGSATTKLGPKPTGKRTIPAHLPEEIFDHDGTIRPASLAVWLDRMRPWAVAPDLATLYRYDEGSGLFVEQRNVHARLVSVLGDDVKRVHSKEVEAALVAQSTRNGRTIGATDDVSRLIVVENGVLDPDTGELGERSPEHLFTSRWPVRWDPDAECPTILAYLERHAPEQVDAVLDTAARMLDRDRVAQDRALFLFGPPRSGKSTILRLLAALVGPESCSSRTLHRLVKNEFGPSALFGMVLNIAGDISSEGVSAEMFNAITGGDQIDCERKGVDAFPFVNRALLAFSANSIPALYGGARAALERFVPVCFPTSFAGHEDPAIEEALMLELDGLLAELVRRHRAGRMPAPLAVVHDEMKVRARRIDAFASACLEPESELPLSSCPTLSDVRKAYIEWLFDTSRGQPESESKLADGLRDAGIEVRHSNGNRVRVRIRPASDRETAFERWLESVSGENRGEQTFGEGVDTQGLDDLDTYFSLTYVREREEKNTVRAHVGEKKVSKSSKPLAVDLETRSSDEIHDDGDGFVRLVVTDAGDGSSVGTSLGPVIDHLRAGGSIAAHNGFGFDFEAIRRAAPDLDIIELADRGQLVDTLLASILADPPMVDFGRSGAAGRVMRHHSLDELAHRLGADGKAGDLRALAKAHGGYGEIPIDDPEYLAYAQRDGELQRLVTDRLELDAYGEREMSVFARLTTGITHTGFAVDADLLAERLAAGRARHDEITAWLVAEHGLPTTTKAGEPSAKPIATEAGRAAIVSAFAELGVHNLRRTKTGAPSVGGDAMREILELDREPSTERILDLAEAVLELQGIRTVYGTIDMHERNGRVHPSVLPLQASGRLSVQSPGLTVLGKRAGKHIEREVLIADPGEVVIAADLSQIDARAVAAHAQDHGYLDLFTGKHDIHTATAIEVLGDAGYREQAKALNHGVNYGMGAGAMVRHAAKVGAVGVTVELAREFLDRMDRKYPKLAAWKSEVRARAEAGVLLDNGFGRTMRADDQRAYTQAPALMGQGAARDLMMECVLRLDVRTVRMLRAIVHDELVFSVPVAELDEVRADITRAMTFDWAPPGADRSVPIVGDMSKPSPSWGGCYAKGGAA